MLETLLQIYIAINCILTFIGGCYCLTAIMLDIPARTFIKNTIIDEPLYCILACIFAPCFVISLITLPFLFKGFFKVVCYFDNLNKKLSNIIKGGK